MGGVRKRVTHRAERGVSLGKHRPKVSTGLHNILGVPRSEGG